MDQSTVLGIAAIVATFVFLDVLFVEVRRCVREVQRIVRRLAAYGELPIFSLAASAGGDVDRMVAALARIPTIVRRGEAALTALNVIRGSLR